LVLSKRVPWIIISVSLHPRQEMLHESAILFFRAMFGL
jgi:hypothetical protein